MTKTVAPSYNEQNNEQNNEPKAYKLKRDLKNKIVESFNLIDFLENSLKEIIISFLNYFEDEHGPKTHEQDILLAELFNNINKVHIHLNWPPLYCNIEKLYELLYSNKEI